MACPECFVVPFSAFSETAPLDEILVSVTAARAPPLTWFQPSAAPKARASSPMPTAPASAAIEGLSVATIWTSPPVTTSTCSMVAAVPRFETSSPRTRPKMDHSGAMMLIAIVTAPANPRAFFCGPCAGASLPAAEPGSLPPDEPASLPPDEPVLLPPDEPASLPPDEPGSLPPDEPASLPPDEPVLLPPDEPASLPPDEPASLPPDEPVLLPPDEPVALAPIDSASSKRSSASPMLSASSKRSSASPASVLAASPARLPTLRPRLTATATMVVSFCARTVRPPPRFSCVVAGPSLARRSPVIHARVSWERWLYLMEAPTPVLREPATPPPMDQRLTLFFEYTSTSPGAVICARR